MITATAKSGSSFKNAPEGSHFARCIGVIDLGTQKTTFQGQEKEQRKVMMAFELTECTEVFDETKGEQPFIIYQEYTLSLSDKANLKKVLESWRGKEFTEQELAGFDIEKLVDKTCLIQVLHKTSSNGNQRAHISSFMKLPAKMEAPVPFNTPYSFSLETYAQNQFDALPEWIQNKIKLSPEYVSAINPNHSQITSSNGTATDDDLPF